MNRPDPLPVADPRHAGRDALSLALMAIRNRTLSALNALEEAPWPGGNASGPAPDLPRWLAGRAAWYQEAWIARNVQRQRGTKADETHPRLASVEPGSDAWFDPASDGPPDRWTLDPPSPERLRRYLEDTLEITLELLAGSADDDDALYFYRRALMHEAQQAEAMAEAAEVVGVQVPGLTPLGRVVAREALEVPASRWTLGTPAGGFAFDNERSAHEVRVPAFAIDAQPVRWGPYVEFVEDGGYDDERWWTPAGWAWLQRSGRRAPRFVEQLRHGVLARRFGRTVRLPLEQPVMHVSAHEAEAWCRWAGRRLPTEVEWELAAHLALSRGFRWGEVWEWTGTTFGPYPGFVADPDRSYSPAAFGTHRVLRGASFATPQPLRHPRYRRFLPTDHDQAFCGFRSCPP